MSTAPRPGQGHIIVLGAGLSGMITALTFANKDKDITILESKSTKDASYLSDPRSTAITAASKEIFVQIGIWVEIEKIAGPIRDIYVVDNKSPEMIHFDSKYVARENYTSRENYTGRENYIGAGGVISKKGRIGRDGYIAGDGCIAAKEHIGRENCTDSEVGRDKHYMGYLVLNSEFKKLLLNLCKKNKHIKLLEETCYKNIDNKDEYTQIELLDGQKINAEMLVICEGKNSKAKAKFFGSAIDKDYNQRAMTFVVEHELPHEGTAIEHFLPSGPFAILPLKDSYKSSIVWTLKNEYADAIEALPFEEFTYFIQDNFGEFLGKVTLTEKPRAYPLSAYHTSRYVNRRMVLVADSAHVIHPLAGQGLNQGIKDIESLVHHVSYSGINNTSLKNYEQERKSDNENMLAVTDTINALFSSNSSLLAAGRKVGFETVERMTPFKKTLMKYAMGRRK